MADSSVADSSKVDSSVENSSVATWPPRRAGDVIGCARRENAGAEQ
ncbi:hypothetical protein [Dickeya chrysanthemi]|uniref:Uncharacterized protein n=1 Tax=Dickeya chrysanthemi TaxID=556 RepID=A0ABU8JT07_DICCH